MPANFNLKGKVVAVTGGASGIGFATTTLLLAQGARVSIADVSDSALKDAETKLQADSSEDQLMTTVVDVRDSAKVDEWIKATVEQFGKLDGAANLAGVIPKSIHIDRVEDLKDDEWKFVIDVNLHGVMHCMRAEIRQMNNKGSIINASSIAGIIGFAKNSAYTASKHAVIGLSRAAAKEVGDRGIRVNCIGPGVIDTPMSRESSKIRGGDDDGLASALKRKAQAAEVAELIAWLLSDGSSFISGSVQVIDGGYVC